MFAIAKGLRVDVVRRPLPGDTSGLLIRREGRNICVINAEHHPNRQRFTLAHELGHFLLHPPQESYDLLARDGRSSEGIHTTEVEANAFAAELLIPEELLRQEVSSILDIFSDDGTIGELAQRFQVSQAAMTHRLTNLRLLSPVA